MAKRKPNLIDLIILLVIVALCGAAVYKFGTVNRNEAAGVADAEELTAYTAFIDEVRQPTVDALHVGDSIYDEKTGICIGTITEVAAVPYERSVLAADGTAMQVEYPDYYSVTLTIEGPVLEKDEGYFIGGVVELKVNSEMNTVTKYAMPVIKVTRIGV